MLTQGAAGLQPMTKKNGHLDLAESLVVNLAHTPSAEIQRGGRVVPHCKVVAYKSYIYVIKIFNFIALQ